MNKQSKKVKLCVIYIPCKIIDNNLLLDEVEQNIVICETLTNLDILQ